MKLKWLGAAALLFLIGLGSGLAAHRLIENRTKLYAKVRQNVILSHARQDLHPIVVVGDSHVELAEIGSLCGKRVLNMGYAGARISTIAEYAPQAFAVIRPRLVIIAVGINDTATGHLTDNASFKQNFGQVINAAQATGASVVAMDIAPIGDDSFAATSNFDRSRRASINQMIREAGVPVLGLDHAMRDTDTDRLAAARTYDGIHFNATGYVVWKRVLAGACAYFPTS